MSVKIEVHYHKQESDTGDSLRHLYCANPHGVLPNAISFCGRKRNTPNSGKIPLREAESKGYCVVCVDLARQSTYCPNCRSL